MHKKLIVQTLLAAFLGLCMGLWVPFDFGWGTITVGGVLGLMGELFLRLLMLMVVPLVIASLIQGSMRLGDGHAWGRLGAKIALAFAVTMGVGVAMGVGSIALWHPIPKELLLSTTGAIEQESSWGRVTDLFLRMIPKNIVQASSEGQILGLILFCTLFGATSTHIAPEASSLLRQFWSGIFQTLIKMTQKVMCFMPVALFALMAQATAQSGVEALWHVGAFASMAVAALAFFALLLFLPLLWVGLSPRSCLRALSPALLMAFSTSSSAAALPVTLECLEKEVGVSNRVASLVISLGIALNLSASALYAGAVVAYVASIQGALPDFFSWFFLYLVTLCSAFGMAGVPSASLVVVLVVLKSLHLPTEQLAYVMAIERFVDMLRTAINVWGSCCCTLVIARSEGESLHASMQRR